MSGDSHNRPSTRKILKAGVVVRFGQTDLVPHHYLCYDLSLTYCTSSLSLSPQLLLALLTASQGLLYYSFTTAMFATRILTTTPRILVVKRTLATFPSTSSSASSTVPRLSTTNPVSVVTGHHDSPLSSESTLHHASFSNTPSEQASKKPFMVDGGVAGGFGGIPMGAFAVSTPFEQH